MKRILLSGGGTGGHIYPALSIMKAVRRRYPEVEVAYIGTKEGLEAQIVPKAGELSFYTVEVQGFKRKLSLGNVRTVYKFLSATRKAKQYIREFRPDVVVGTGGYVSGPSVYAAYQLGIPTLIHEQNVVLGLTTRFLSRYVDRVAISFEGSRQYLNQAKSVILTGNPRATEVAHADAEAGRASLGLSSDKPLILFVGGSRGAQPLNKAVLELIPKVKEADQFHFVYVTGEVHYQKVMKELDLDTLPNLTVKPFIYNMPDVLAATSLVISRAGASTLAELTSLGIPSILVPSPYVTANHQELNARWMEKEGAVVVLLEKECSGSKLWDMIMEIMTDKERHQQMSIAAKKLGKPEAAEVLVDELEKIVQERQDL